ncbi:hypothetical protein JCM14076_23340 [Methylosoma difficile]
MPSLFKTLPSLAALALSGCATLPNGPSVMVLPGNHQSFAQFRNDDSVCQQFAAAQVGNTTANEAAVNSGVGNAIVGTAVGAAAGAAIGGGGGAAIGAGTGLVAGSLIGSSTANGSMYELQQRFDAAYIQCMYAKGHQVPVSGHFSDNTPTFDERSYAPNSLDNQNNPNQYPLPPTPPPGLPPEPPLN